MKEKQLCEFTMNKQINKTHFYIDVAHERKKRPWPVSSICRFGRGYSSEKSRPLLNFVPPSFPQISLPPQLHLSDSSATGGNLLFGLFP